MKYYCDKQRHLVCVPYSIENLIKMGDDLGLGRHWFHGGKYPHYDIPVARIPEITRKCTVVRPRDILTIIKTFAISYP